VLQVSPLPFTSSLCSGLPEFQLFIVMSYSRLDSLNYSCGGGDDATPQDRGMISFPLIPKNKNLPVPPPNSSINNLVALTWLSTLAVNGLLVICGMGLLGDKYVTADPDLSAPNAQVGHIMTYLTTVGVAAVLLGAFFGPALASYLLIVTLQSIRTTGAVRTLGLVLVQTSAAFGMAFWAWNDLVVARDTYNVVERFDDTQRGGNKPDTLKQFLGGLLFTTFSLLTLAGVGVMIKNVLPEVFRIVSSGNTRNSVVAADFQPTTAKLNVWGMYGLSATLIGCFIATTIFT
jgi:hypothetical protein